MREYCRIARHFNAVLVKKRRYKPVWVRLPSGYGNIQPMELGHIEGTVEYKEALQLVNSNYDRLQEGLTDKQKELLIKYAESRNEFSNITEFDAFKVGFSLGVRILIESLS